MQKNFDGECGGMDWSESNEGKKRGKELKGDKICTESRPEMQERQGEGATSDKQVKVKVKVKIEVGRNERRDAKSFSWGRSNGRKGAMCQ